MRQTQWPACVGIGDRIASDRAVKCTINSLRRANIRSNGASRLAYNGLLALANASAPVNRTAPPPHFYIEAPVKVAVPNSGDTDLVRRLSLGASGLAESALGAGCGKPTLLEMGASMSPPEQATAEKQRKYPDLPP